MYLVHQLLNLCRDARQQVRDAAITNIFRSVSMYGTTRSRQTPDYRPDIDGLMPLQSAVLEVVAALKLDEVPGAASAVLSDLSEYLTLAFVAPFESEPGPGTASRIRPQSVTYIALAKEVMPHVLWLFQSARKILRSTHQEPSTRCLLPTPPDAHQAQLPSTRQVRFRRAVVEDGDRQLSCRIRQEELTYVLQKLLATRLRDGTL
ncbi:hypothetical protein JCM1840_006198 [Sporobolomyces johnsonii]